jgi:hypothetical protein
MKPPGQRKHLTQVIERNFSGSDQSVESILPGSPVRHHGKDTFTRLSDVRLRRPLEFVSVTNAYQIAMPGMLSRWAETENTRLVEVISCLGVRGGNVADHFFQQGLLKVASITAGIDARLPSGNSKAPRF